MKRCLNKFVEIVGLLSGHGGLVVVLSWLGTEKNRALQTVLFFTIGKMKGKLFCLTWRCRSFGIEIQEHSISCFKKAAEERKRGMHGPYTVFTSDE